MLYPHNEKHGEIELINNSIFLYHSTLIQIINDKESTKKDILLFYLFGYREISRYQIMNLLSYSQYQDNESTRMFISRFVTAGFLQREAPSNKSNLEDMFVSTKKGNDYGKKIFSSVLKKTLMSPKNKFHEYVSALLWNEKENIEEYVSLFTEFVSRQSRARPSRHMVAVRDSFITLLHSLPYPAVQEFRTEASITNGKVNRTHGLPSFAEIRCDAMVYMPLERTDQPAIPYPDESLLVCIEQDTLHQTTEVLSDKIERYLDHLLFPRLKAGLTPPVLVFSILPHVRKKKDNRMPCLSKIDRKKMEAIICFGILYCRHTGIPPESISIEEFERELRYWHDNDECFKEYTDFLAGNLDRIGRYLPLSMLRERYLELSSKEGLYEPVYARYKASYAKRRDTVFSAALSSPTILRAALSGFSICTADNYEPATLLSLFPCHSNGDDVFRNYMCRNGSAAERIECVPFYRHRYGNGTEITFRFAYRCGTEVYVVENMSDDILGELRLRHLLANEEKLAVIPVAVVSADDFPRMHETIHSHASARQREKFLYFIYTPTQYGGIKFGEPAGLP